MQAPEPSHWPSRVPRLSQGVPAAVFEMPQPPVQVSTPGQSVSCMQASSKPVHTPGPQVTDAHCGLAGGGQDAGGASGFAQGSKTWQTESHQKRPEGSPGGSQVSGDSMVPLPQTARLWQKTGMTALALSSVPSQPKGSVPPAAKPSSEMDTITTQGVRVAVAVVTDVAEQVEVGRLAADDRRGIVVRTGNRGRRELVRRVTATGDPVERVRVHGRCRSDEENRSERVVDQEVPSGLGDIFAQFRRAAGGGAPKARAASRRRGEDIHTELQIPFGTSITGGEAQITVRRSSAKTETIKVKIPEGIASGKKIRIRGQGQPGPRRGTPGDVLITIHVAPHPCFERRGNHLHVKVPVTLAEAALGAKVDLPTPRGTVSVSIPPGSSGGTKLRVKGHGAAPKNGPPGDLLAEIQIVLPPQLTESDQQMIRQLGERYPQNPRANLKW